MSQFKVQQIYEEEFSTQIVDESICIERNMIVSGYQKFVLRYFNDYNRRGMLVYHGIGTGKSITSIIWARDLPILYYISIKVLHKNFRREIFKFLEGRERTNFLNKIKYIDINNITIPRSFEGSSIIIDESHIFMNMVIEGGLAKDLWNKLYETQDIKILCLSATPIYRYPFELSPLFNLLSGQELFPRTADEFQELYINDIDQI